MTDSSKPEPGGKPSEVFLRCLSGAAGVAAILAGILLPLLFAAAADEAWELVPALGFAALCAFAAYLLIRFASKGPKPR